MAKNTQVIRIESILGGHSPTTHFAAPDQFRFSIGIDPSLPISSTTGDVTGGYASGIIRPVGVTKLSGSVVDDIPLWIKANPKSTNLYIYDAHGSVYIDATTVLSPTALSDGGALTGSSGNGCEYYDNYMYFAKDTTIARYGPLNGTPSFTGDYWGVTLGKTALTDTEGYPTDYIIGQEIPNHYLHRHSDGKLYIADVVDNQGTIHYIKTSKTTVEGDTDAGSKYDALNFGYGLWPTCMESYGDILVIGLVEFNNGASTSLGLQAKLAFWDTTSENANLITLNEYPDTTIYSIKNLNGVLYVVSGNSGFTGFRIMKYIGGSSFEEVFFNETGGTPFPGGVATAGNSLLVGGFSFVPNLQPSVFSVGLRKHNLSNGIFNVAGSSGSLFASSVTSLIDIKSVNADQPKIYMGWGTSTRGSANNGIDITSSNLSGNSGGGAFWYSQLYKIGQPFKITKISFSLAKALESGQQVTFVLLRDNSFTNSKSFSTILTPFNTAGTRRVALRPENFTADNTFYFYILFGGTVISAVELPIIIEYELLDVDSTYQ